MALLETLNGSEGLKKLNIKQLTELSAEIREKIIGGAYENGGHLASNLGVIELTVAIHYVFDIPADKLVFDVGHQCYTHKILTGRLDRFDTIRKEGGISGFPNIEESEADAFSSGHAGTAVAAGMGYCYARDRLGESYKVISLVGDGAFLNGLSTEALMSAEKKPNNFVLVLNDNGMSISKNTSGMYKVLSKATTKSPYEKFKKGLKKIFGNSFITKWLTSVRDFFKRVISKGNYLDNLGFKYVGVIDGHDMKELVKTLRIVKNSDKPVLLHVKTVKGKGYKQAEDKAEKFHGVSKYFAESNNAFSSALAGALDELYEKDNRIHAITAAMADGTGLNAFAEKHPEAFTDVGICEEYAVTLAAGMAIGGIKPVVCIYSTFMQRAYDEILHDVCLQNLGVTFCLDRAGVVGPDGQTHQGVFDLSYLGHLPNMTVLAPKNVAEFKEMLSYAVNKDIPVAIRYPNGGDYEFKEAPPLPVTEWEKLTGDGEATVLCVGGRALKAALEAAEKSARKLCVVNARCVKPLDADLLSKICDRPIITVEENAADGGFGAAVAAHYAAAGIAVKIKSINAGDGVIKQADVKRQLEKIGITAENIIAAAEAL